MRPTLRGAFALLTMVAALSFATPAHAQWTSDGGVLIRGTIVTMDDHGTVVKGSLLIQGGVIKDILPANAPCPKGCIEIDTKGGLIFPGLMNLHNHISYNFEALYDLPKTYTNRDQWPGAKQYGPAVNNPHAIVTKGELYDYGTEALKYAEVKSLVGGETTVQGTESDPGAGTILVRNVELPNFGQDKISQSVLPIDQRFVADLVAQKKKITSADGFFFHLAEGSSDPSNTYSRKEYYNPDYDPKKNAGAPKNIAGLKNLGLIVPSLIGIHCAGLQEEDFADWEKITGEPKIVWSPLSNMLLYGNTTKILAARRHHATIALGTDWSPSGSKNLLWELKVADQVNEQIFKKEDGKGLTTQDLVAMVTRNPAHLVHWDDKVGQIKKGMQADLLVIDGAGGKDPYRGLIDSVESNVQLVLVGGDPLYGDEGNLKKLKVYNGTPAYEVLPESPAGRKKALDLKRKVPKGDESLDDIKKDLLEALKMDPKTLAEKLNTADPRAKKNDDPFKDRTTTKAYLRTKLAAKKKPVPADLNDPKAPITADEVAQYLKLRFPDAHPIDRLDPIYQQGDQAYFDALEKNIYFKSAKPPIDLTKFLTYPGAASKTPGMLAKVGATTGSGGSSEDQDEPPR